MKKDTHYAVFGAFFMVCYIIMFLSILMYIWTLDTTYIKILFTSIVTISFVGIFGKMTE
jgi:hypothetical protein